MNFDLRPHHAARVLAFIFMIPVFWVLVVQGVTTTTEFDLRTGEYSSSSDLWTQIGKVVVFIFLGAACALGEKYLKANNTPWPLAVQEQLTKVGLGPAGPTQPQSE